jgi:hypothetical protein
MFAQTLSHGSLFDKLSGDVEADSHGDRRFFNVI